MADNGIGKDPYADIFDENGNVNPSVAEADKQAEATMEKNRDDFAHDQMFFGALDELRKQAEAEANARKSQFEATQTPKEEDQGVKDAPEAQSQMDPKDQENEIKLSEITGKLLEIAKLKSRIYQAILVREVKDTTKEGKEAIEKSVKDKVEGVVGPLREGSKEYEIAKEKEAQIMKEYGEKAGNLGKQYMTRGELINGNITKFEENITNYKAAITSQKIVLKAQKKDPAKKQQQEQLDAKLGKLEGKKADLLDRLGSTTDPVETAKITEELKAINPDIKKAQIMSENGPIKGPENKIKNYKEKLSKSKEGLKKWKTLRKESRKSYDRANNDLTASKETQMTKQGAKPTLKSRLQNMLYKMGIGSKNAIAKMGDATLKGLTAGAALAGAGMLAMNGKVQEAIKSTGDIAKVALVMGANGLEAVGEKTLQAKDAVITRVGQAKEAVVTRAGQAKDTVVQGATNAKEAVTNAGRAVVTGAKDTAGRAVQGVKSTTGRVVQGAKDMKGRVAQGISDKVNEVYASTTKQYDDTFSKEDDGDER